MCLFPKKLLGYYFNPGVLQLYNLLTAGLFSFTVLAMVKLVPMLLFLEILIISLINHSPVFSGLFSKNLQLGIFGSIFLRFFFFLWWSISLSLFSIFWAISLALSLNLSAEFI